MFNIQVHTESKRYPVFIGTNILDRIGPVLKKYVNARVILVVSDSIVAPLYAGACREALQGVGFSVELAEFQCGERSKSLEAASALYDRAITTGLSRGDAILALGGGVTGDLTGFVAATYLRGIAFIQVPTTLLAMVDSSVGGKVAVNHSRGKNLIGAFYQPAAVFADTALLRTLPEREFIAGLAEVVKCGLIGDQWLFQRLETLSLGRSKGGSEVLAPSGILLKKLIARSVMLKRNVVLQDEKENDLRRVLNLGHTFGHALEASTGYDYFLHGEAVAWGMALAARLSRRLKLLSEENEKRIIRVVRWLDPPGPPGYLTRDSLVDALQYDKKREQEGLVFVLPVDIGRVIFYRSPPWDAIQEALDAFLQEKILLE